MGYHLVDPDDLEKLPDRSASAFPVSAGTGLERLGVRLYEADPGEQLPMAYHYHEKQEETFYVIEGELHVETPGQTYVVPAGQVFLVEPGNPHRAHNPEMATETVRILAAGTPTDDGGIPYEQE